MASAENNVGEQWVTGKGCGGAVTEMAGGADDDRRDMPTARTERLIADARIADAWTPDARIADARTPDARVAEAWACARAAADRHGMRVIELHEATQHHAAADLYRRVWRADSPDSVINANMITALAHAGNYVAGAYQGDQLVGAAVGFFGDDPALQPALHLHSHITGIAPGRQGGGVGYLLKQHQRAWSLSRGIAVVCWTFDPLVRRNAYFNMHKLGALPTGYLPDFYGPMTDGINTGDASDRLYIVWRLGSRRAVAAAHGDPSELDPAALRSAGAVTLVDRDGDRVAPTGAALPDADRVSVVLVAVPLDIEALRGQDFEAATAWRYAVREALTAALAAGYRITGMTRDGYYVLQRGEDPE